jgi:hypothetical protein
VFVNTNLTFWAEIAGLGRCYLSAFFAEKVTSPMAGSNRKVFRLTMYFVWAVLGTYHHFRRKMREGNMSRTRRLPAIWFVLTRYAHQYFILHTSHLTPHIFFVSLLLK